MVDTFAGHVFLLTLIKLSLFLHLLAEDPFILQSAQEEGSVHVAAPQKCVRLIYF